jgi:quercetin dioxygenase-like cupin family protein
MKLPSIFKRTKRVVEELENFKTTLETVSFNLPVKFVDQETTDKFYVLNPNGFVTISSKKYTEVAPGIYDRVIRSKDATIYEWEKDVLKILSEETWKDYVVIICKFDTQSKLEYHTHNTEERITLLEGSYFGTENKLFKKGDTQIIPAHTLHQFVPVENGKAIVLLKKSHEK